MDIESLVKRITLPSRVSTTVPWEARRPSGELLIDTPTYDMPITGHPEAPFWDLYDVTPAVIATSGRGAGRFWAHSGLRVGLLMITQFETYPSEGPSDPPRTAYVSPGNGTSWYHQLADLEGEKPEFPGLFDGGTVSWGDGYTDAIDSALSMVQHTYDAAGTYDIKLTLNFAPSNNFAWSNNPSAVRRLTIN